jgi:hypothetical protein
MYASSFNREDAAPMTNILNTVAKQVSKFIPSNMTQYLVLQVARRLSDEMALRHYLVLFEHHSEDILLQVFRKCSAEQNLTGTYFMRSFRELTLQET